MTPEEKSKELFDKFYSPIEDFDLEHEVTCISERKLYAKQCALIAVEEIIKELERVVFNYDMVYHFKEVSPSKTTIPYWQQVKQAIEKM